jgi:acyl-CoA reductase-like NAD-dependent aldehyde dehydrogenase
MLAAAAAAAGAAASLPTCSVHRKVGDPFKPDTQHGPQINSNQLEKIQNYVDMVSGYELPLHVACKV